ncbi:DNA-processing protein DprA [Parasediminibacterium sp. JCM 36343]|uniref:DNA-processing protein DprA n=1 Tax=Parasediminibacterium sp. JCM 36343 TaxID=3374279 RepID=UPI00397944F2
MENDILYQIALTQINGIGVVQAKLLLEHFGNAATIFTAPRKTLGAVEGIGEIRANAIKNFTDFKAIEEEINFCGKHHIEILFLTDAKYPKRLLHCYDAPTVLYYRGTANLNTARTVSIIGTRLNTDYGKQVTEQLVHGLKDQQALIVSGMAFGIDAIAHKAAVQQGLSTVGVLAHGLDTIYPAQHKGLAKDMLLNGGLLTEFPRLTKPDKHNFPRRNRIVAGMADATVVVETAAKGGSMITAELAYNYNRDLFAVPGKITDSKSTGCLKLIQQNKAAIYTDVAQLMETMGWHQKKTTPKKQRELFIDLSEDEKTIVAILQTKETVHIDELYHQSGLSSSSVASAMLTLELQNVIVSLPGKMYRMM